MPIHTGKPAGKSHSPPISLFNFLRLLLCFIWMAWAVDGIKIAEFNTEQNIANIPRSIR